MKGLFLSFIRRMLAIILFFASIEVASAEDVTINGIIYSIDSSSASVKGYTSAIPKDVIIPDTITYNNKQYGITLIRQSAFENCTKLESISIPASVTQLGDVYFASMTYYKSVFKNCISLKQVRFEDGNSILRLGSSYYGNSSYSKGMFSDSPLEEIYIGRNIEYIDYSSSSKFESYPQYYGYSAFYNQENLKTVIIGANVNNIPRNIFSNCTGLKYVDFGNSLESIPIYAFSYCSSLTSVILPSSVSSIGNYAFDHCSSITNANIGSSETIGSNAFYGASELQHIIMSTSLRTISNEAFALTTSLQEIELPNTLDFISAAAFKNSGLISIDIPESVTYVGSEAFYGNASLKSASFGKSDIEMGNSVFEACEALETVNIYNQQKSIPLSCFSSCYSLKNLVLGEGLTTIGQSAFENCTNLESISIPASVTQLGDVYYASMTYYKSVFKNCTSLKQVRFEDGNSIIRLGSSYYGNSSYSKGMFSDSPLEEIYIGRNIEYIDYSSSSKFGSYPQYYGYSAFYSQENLKTVIFGANVNHIPIHLLKYCSALENILSFSENPATIADNTFPDYNATLYVPVNALDAYASADYWKNFTNHVAMISEGDLLFVPNGEKTLAVTKYPGASPEQVVVPSSVESNGNSYSVTEVLTSAFKSCEDLTLISLPSSVERIGENAFAYNQKLSSLTFNGQKYIGKGAFRNCPSITGLTLPNSLETIGEMAFYENTGITQISFGSGLKNIESQAFAGCRSLTAIRLPEGTESIGKSSFENCIKLTYATLGSSLASIGDRSFFNCQALTEIEIPGATKTVGSSAFEKCINLTLATLNNGTQTLGENTFKDCESLLIISVPGSVTSIGSGSFDNCISLSSVTFAAGEQPISIAHFQDSPLKTLRIGRNLVYSYGETSAPFRNKTTLTRVAFTGNYVTNLYFNLFDGCSGITSITLPNTLKTINDRAFKSCTGLTSIIVPEGVTEVGGYCFDDCSSLSSASLPTTLPILETYLFHNCTSLESILLHEGVTNIKSHCFDNCNFLAGITIPSTTQEIEDYSFEKCLSLKDLTFTDGSTPIALASERSMFRDCPLESMYVGRNIDYSEENIENVPFYDRDNLVNVTISDKEGVTYLRDYFLNEASALPSITIPDNVNNVGKYALANCAALESANLSNSLTILNEGLLQNDVALKSLIIPAAVKTVDKYVIGNCIALNNLRFSDSSNPISTDICAEMKGMCAETALETLYIGRNIDYDATEDYGYSPFYGLTTLKNISFTDKGYVTRCDDNYFMGCSAAETLNLPESLVTIGDRAFMDMSALNYCRMYNNVESVGQYGFANDESLTDLTFSTKVRTLRNNLFQNCTSLPRFTVHPAVTKIEDNAFMNTTSLASLSFTDSSDLLNIGRRYEDSNYASMFADSPLESLYLSRWLIYNIDDDSYAPFYGRDHLTDLRFGETLGDIGKYLFEKCTSLQVTDIPGVESIGEKAFFDCSMLKDVTFNEGTRSIGEHTFAQCVSLQNVKLPSSVVSVSDGCFENDNNLSTLDLGSSLEIIGPSAFSGCNSLQELVIPSTLYGLGVESFKDCTSLPYLTIPNGGSLSSIGARAFQGCTGIEWVSLSNKITSMGANSFDGCNNIRFIKSYNTTPPVGLPNFAQTVIDNATVFAPAEAVSDYQDADVWWEFFDIRAMGDGVFVSYLNIDQESVALKAADTFQIIAEAGPAEASNTAVGYLSDNMEVATVDNTGLITAISVGEANVKVYAKDGSGYYKICKVTVNPTLMTSIGLNHNELNLRVNRTAQLNTEIYPLTATNQSIVWRSSNSNIAAVDESGKITAVYDGIATITAAAADGSGVVATCIVTVLPPMTGDSNDDDNLTITDAVNTANYAMGISCEVFNFRAADVNADNRITIADASATVTELLNQDISAASMMMRRMSRGIQDMNIDFDQLTIDNYTCIAGKTTKVDVKLDATRDYVALQADIAVPEGMTILGVEIGDRASAYHSIMQRTIDNHTMRIALFDAGNSTFADNDEALLHVIVKADNASGGDITMSNIIASDALAHEFILTATGGHNSNTSGITDIYGNGSIIIKAADGGIDIYSAEGRDVFIFTMDGIKVGHFRAESEKVWCGLSSGNYIVVAGDSIEKIFVK